MNIFSFKSSHRRCSVRKVKFCKFHRKTPVLECLVNKVVSLQNCSFIKKKLQHSCFPLKFAKFLRTPILKSICEKLLLQFLSHGSMFIIYVQIYQPKIKCKDGGSYLHKNQNYRPLEIKTKSFFVNSFQKTLIFHICFSSENAQCFVSAFL